MQELSKWLPLGGLALLIPFWQQALTLVQRFRSYFVVKTLINDDMLAYAITAHLEKGAKFSKLGDKIYTASSLFVRPKKRNLLVAWEVPRQKIYWVGRWPVFYTVEKPKERSETTILITLRGFNVENLIAQSVAEENEYGSTGKTGSSRFYVKSISAQGMAGRRPNTIAPDEQVSRARETNSFEQIKSVKPLLWERSDIGDVATEKGPFSGLSFSEEVGEALKEFDYWLASREWFEERGIPWRRGWLLQGLPGTGKSRLARALGQYGDMPIWSYDLSTLTNTEFTDYWSTMLSAAPVIALFEDFDAVFHGRENIAFKEGGLTFDCLLNTISGVSQANGVFLLITTNHIEHIDPAIGIPKNGVSTRPGRIDRIVSVGELPERCRREIAGHILDKWPDEVERIVAGSEGYTGAQVTDLCIKIAEKKFWEKSECISKQ